MTDRVITRGDAAWFAVGPVINVNTGNPQDITGYTVRLTAKDRLDDLDANAIISVIGTIVDGPAGLASVVIPGAATDGFTTDRVLLYDVQISDPGGAKKTLDSGKLRVVRDVTRA